MGKSIMFSCSLLLPNTLQRLLVNQDKHFDYSCLLFLLFGLTHARVRLSAWYSIWHLKSYDDISNMSIGMILIHVCHSPPGCSNWVPCRKKFLHCLFALSQYPCCSRGNNMSAGALRENSINTDETYYYYLHVHTVYERLIWSEHFRVKLKFSFLEAWKWD